MIRLKPHEILQHLGFQVGEEGIETNPNDAFLITEVLRSLGATMSVDRIPESQLRDLHRSCRFLAGVTPAPATDLAPHRAHLKALIERQFQFRPDLARGPESARPTTADE